MMSCSPAMSLRNFSTNGSFSSLSESKSSLHEFLRVLDDDDDVRPVFFLPGAITVVLAAADTPPLCLRSKDSLASLHSSHKRSSHERSLTPFFSFFALPTFFLRHNR